jgi:hypothetical protein
MEMFSAWRVAFGKSLGLLIAAMIVYPLHFWRRALDEFSVRIATVLGQRFTGYQGTDCQGEGCSSGDDLAHGCLQILTERLIPA